jgi:hypothetical protein
MNDAVTGGGSFHRRAVRVVPVQLGEIVKGSPRSICPSSRLATISCQPNRQPRRQREKHQ